MRLLVVTAFESDEPFIRGSEPREPVQRAQAPVIFAGAM
jgi:hypothetical protein